MASVNCLKMNSSISTLGGCSSLYYSLHHDVRLQTGMCGWKLDLKYWSTTWTFANKDQLWSHSHPVNLTIRAIVQLWQEEGWRGTLLRLYCCSILKFGKRLLKQWLWGSHVNWLVWKVYGPDKDGIEFGRDGCRFVYSHMIEKRSYTPCNARFRVSCVSSVLIG